MILLTLTSFALGGYDHFATWEIRPEIYLCESSLTTKNMLASSIQDWKDMGYKFGEIHLSKSCPSNKEGKIIIREKQFTQKQGNTEVFTYHYGDHVQHVDYAIVEINQKIQLYTGENKESLTHELGHALGIDHVRDKNDIMYPYTK